MKINKIILIFICIIFLTACTETKKTIQLNTIITQPLSSSKLTNGSTYDIYNYYNVTNNITITNNITYITNITNNITTGGSVTNEYYIFKNISQIQRNNSNLQRDNTLNISLNSNSIYEFEIFVRYTIGFNGDFKFCPIFPVDSYNVYWGFLSQFGSAIPYTKDLTYAVTVGSNQTEKAFLIKGFVSTINAGELYLNWSQNTAYLEDAIVLNGSFLKLKKII